MGDDMDHFVGEDSVCLVDKARGRFVGNDKGRIGVMIWNALGEKIADAYMVKQGDAFWVTKGNAMGVKIADAGWGKVGNAFWEGDALKSENSGRLVGEDRERL